MSKNPTCSADIDPVVADLLELAGHGIIRIEAIGYIASTVRLCAVTAFDIGVPDTSPVC